MKKFLFLTATFALLGCGNQKDQSSPDTRLQSVDSVTTRVINGSIPDAGSYESVALLLSEANVSIQGAPATRRPLSICTATLISPTAVLSAAHCVNDMILRTAIQRATGPDGKPLNAKIEGAIMFRVASVKSVADLPEHPELVSEVARVTEHEDFALTKNPWAAFQKNPGQWNDVSVVHLAKPVTGRRIQKLATADQFNAQLSDSSLGRLFAGYGLTVEKDPTTAGTLMEGTARLGEAGATEFIAGANDEQVACHGDSGGPIFLDKTDGVQIGIASRINKQFGLGDIFDGITGNAKAPSCELGLVYSRVDAYIGWIKKNVPDFGKD